MCFFCHLCPEMHAIPNITKIAHFRNFCYMIFKTIFSSASCLTALTKITDLTEIPKITDIAIFRIAFAKVTEIMQIINLTSSWQW